VPDEVVYLEKGVLQAGVIQEEEQMEKQHQEFSA